MAGLGAIENIHRHIEVFHAARTAGGDQLKAAVRLVEQMSPPAISDGTALCAMALAGRNLVKQLLHAHDSAIPFLRNALGEIACAMDAEFHSGPGHQREIPWHMRNN